VVIHAAGVTSAVRWLRDRATAVHNFWGGTWLFVRLAGWMIFLGLVLGVGTDFVLVAAGG